MNSLLEQFTRAISARLAAETALKDAQAAELKAFGELERSLKAPGNSSQFAAYDRVMENGDRQVLSQRPLHRK